MKESRFTNEERIRISKLHVEEGKTQSDLAKEYSVSQSTIGRWVVHYRNMKLMNKHDNILRKLTISEI